MTAHQASSKQPIILLLDGEVLARSAIASYLRECGYEVVEASDERDAKAFLASSDQLVDIAILAATANDLVATLEFSRWLRSQYPHTRTLLAANMEKEAKIAAEICDEGPHLRKPYERQALVDWIKRLRI